MQIKKNLWNRIVNKSYEIASEMDNIYKHMSFILYKSSIVSVGRNYQFKTHTQAVRMGYRYGFIHSELNAVVNFPFEPAKLRDCVLVNTRVGKNGLLSISRPCQNCQRMIVAMGFKKVLYTNEFGLLEEFNYEYY